MGERRGPKALELWCRRITEGYPGVNVQNMTTSWRDGLAFCAMIHHFRPDLIDFNSLNKDDVYGNNELAFRTAEQHLGIPALLDAEDMASCSVPDRLSILTYLSQFYQTFVGSSPSRLAMNRTTETADDRIAPVPESPKPKVGSRLAMRRDTCAACGLPVFLAEKLVIARTPYHRTCFRCARCNNQLTPGNYYETEEGQYCCEACPDEVSSMPTSMHQKYNEDIMSATSRDSVQGATTLPHAVCKRSLSDEEKSSKGTLDSSRSGLYETGRMLDSRRSSDSSRRLQDSTVPDLIAQTSQMRLNFMASHLLSEREVEETSAVDGTRIERSPSERDLPHAEDRKDAAGRIVSALPDDDEIEDAEEDEGEELDEEEASSSADSSRESINRDNDPEEPAVEDSSSVNVVNNALKDNLDVKLDEEQRLTAISFHDVVKGSSVSLNSREDNTKELLGKADERGDSEEGLSLVQKRLRMFETQDKKNYASKERKQTKSAFGVREPNVQSADRSDNEVENHDNSCSRLDVPISRDVSSKTESQKTDEPIGTKDEPPTIYRIPPSSEEVPHTRNDDSKGDSESSKIDDSEVQRNRCEKSFNGAIASPEKERMLSPQKSTEAVSHEMSINVESSRDDVSADPANETSLTKAEGIDLSAGDDYPEDLNPFKSDDEENAIDNYHTAMDTSKRSTNPFDTDEDDEESDEGQTERDIVPPKPATRTTIGTNKLQQQSVVDMPTKRRLVAPQINLNPFWSDDDEHDSDLESKDPPTPASAPVPKPRTIKNTPELGVAHRTLDLSRGDLYASNTSIASSESATTPGGTYRKKKPAPPPPTAKELFPSEQRISPMPKPFNGSTGYLSTSPRTTPRARKSKPAPPPPMPTSTPYNVTMGAPLNFAESPITEPGTINDNESLRVWDDQKTNKDETNRNRQSLTNVSSEEGFNYKGYLDKSVQGKWKRKKGPAPPRPTPHRRKIKVISMKDVKLELDEIELQQQGLEKQGVRLEQLIRDKCESGNNKTEDSSLSMDVEELVLELFALVNEKNELFRRQAELMLLRRQQRLEEEHAEVEYQIRCLMSQPEAIKTDFDKQREELLIQRLVEIVERRNEIVECLEMDRRREVEEDRSIHKHMGLYAARNKNEISGNYNDTNNSSKTKKGKTKEKVKEKKSKKTSKKDADKDVDETEVKLKRHTKRKWF